VGGFLIILIILAAGWFILAVPARRRRASHEAMQNSVGVGDEIITAGGMHGTVREITDDLVDLEIAPSVVVKLDRRAIAAVAKEVEIEGEAELEPERDSGPAPEESPEPS
jgi:preprotein translocase subunit YajC